jgi:hypothetical protein
VLQRGETESYYLLQEVSIADLELDNKKLVDENHADKAMIKM